MKRLHLVCNAHIDPAWQWSWQEGAGVALSTFRVAADLCEKQGCFVFNHNEALLYSWVEQYDAELFARIQRLVRQGKWNIIGGWYLQPDCNMLSGESLIRQITFGQQYFSEKFGVKPTTAFNPDSFGHTRGLVQILRKYGYDSYIICRPNRHQCPIPENTFLWEGFDGSRVMVQRMDLYNTPIGQAAEFIRRAADSLDKDVGMFLWGVGDHGGGPSALDLKKISALMAEEKDVLLLHSTPEAYFREMRPRAAELPVVKKSLQNAFVGCYTSQIRVKQAHRVLENELITAEKMASHACLTGLAEYPQAELTEAWKALMMSEFHDILPGSGVRTVEEYGLRLLGSGIETARRVQAAAFFALAAGQPKAQQGRIPVLVYNPHPYTTFRTLECEFMLADQNRGDVFLLPVVEQGGEEVPSQPEKEESNVPIEWRKKVVFRAELAPCSISRFDIRLKTLRRRPDVQTAFAGDAFVVQAPSYSARLSRKTGLLESYRADGFEYIRNSAGKLLVCRDVLDPWGMNVDGFQEILGQFALADSRETARVCGTGKAEMEPVRIIEDGPVRTVLEAVFLYEESCAVIRYYFPKNEKEIRIHVLLHVATKDILVKFAAGTVFENGKLQGKTAFGLDDLRTDGNEAVACDYAVVHDGRNALSVINSGTYGLSFHAGELRLSLLRTPAYCAHPIDDRPLLDENRYAQRIDMGEREFDFYLNASGAEERLENIEAENGYIQEKPYVLSYFPQPRGEMPLPLCRIDNPAIELSAFYRDEGGYTMRLFNSTATRQRATVELPALQTRREIELKGYEFENYPLSPNTGPRAAE